MSRGSTGFYFYGSSSLVVTQIQACKKGFVSVVEVLLRCKGEVNTKDRYHIIMISSTNEAGLQYFSSLPSVLCRHINHFGVRIISCADLKELSCSILLLQMGCYATSGRNICWSSADSQHNH